MALRFMYIKFRMEMSTWKQASTYHGIKDRRSVTARDKNTFFNFPMLCPLNRNSMRAIF